MATHDEIKQAYEAYIQSEASKTKGVKALWLEPRKSIRLIRQSNKTKKKRNTREEKLCKTYGLKGVPKQPLNFLKIKQIQ